MTNTKKMASASYIEAHVISSHRSRKEIAELSGFKSENFIDVLVGGHVKLPLDKVKPMAQALDADWRELFGLVIRDWYSGEMVELFSSYFREMR